MCELLVKAVDATHPNPAKDRRGCYKAGDVVFVAEDGHSWGAGELDTSVFTIVKMPGVPVSEMRYLLAPEPATLKDFYPRSMTAMKRLTPVLGKRTAGEVHRRKRWNIDNGQITRKPAGD